MNEREAFLFFRNWHDAIRQLPKEMQADAYAAIMDYALDGKEPEDGIARAIVCMAAPIIDKSRQNYQNGKKGGRKKTETGKSETEIEKQETETEPNETESEKCETEIGNCETETEPNETETGKSETEPEPLYKNKNKKKNKNIYNITPLPPSLPENAPKDPVEESNLSEPVKEKLREWLQYKRERREGYKPTGLRSLITQVEKHEQEHGSIAVINIIDHSMGSGYKGILWDRIGGRDSPGQISRSGHRVRSPEELAEFAAQMDAQMGLGPSLFDLGGGP